MRLEFYIATGSIPKFWKLMRNGKRTVNKQIKLYIQNEKFPFHLQEALDNPFLDFKSPVLHALSDRIKTRWKPLMAFSHSLYSSPPFAFKKFWKSVLYTQLYLIRRGKKKTNKNQKQKQINTSAKFSFLFCYYYNEFFINRKSWHIFRKHREERKRKEK